MGPERENAARRLSSRAPPPLTFMLPSPPAFVWPPSQHFSLLKSPWRPPASLISLLPLILGTLIQCPLDVDLCFSSRANAVPVSTASTTETLLSGRLFHSGTDEKGSGRTDFKTSLSIRDVAIGSAGSPGTPHFAASSSLSSLPSIVVKGTSSPVTRPAQSGIPALQSLCGSTGASSATRSSLLYSSLRVIGQGASGITYVLPADSYVSDITPPGLDMQELGNNKDVVLKIGTGDAAVKALRNEASLLQRLADRGVGKGVEQLVGFAECQISADGEPLHARYENDADKGSGESSILRPGRQARSMPGKVEQRAVLAMQPYWPQAEQVDRIQSTEGVRELVRLLIRDVAVQGGVIVSDVQVLESGVGEEPAADGNHGTFLLIDLTEGMVLVENIEESPAEKSPVANAALRSFLGEVASLVAYTAEAHTAAVEESKTWGMPVLCELVREAFPMAAEEL